MLFPAPSARVRTVNAVAAVALALAVALAPSASAGTYQMNQCASASSRATSVDWGVWNNIHGGSYYNTCATTGGSFGLNDAEMDYNSVAGLNINVPVQNAPGQRKLRPTSKSITMEPVPSPTSIGCSTYAYSTGIPALKPQSTPIGPLIAVTDDLRVSNVMRSALYLPTGSVDDPSNAVCPFCKSSRLNARFGSAIVTQMPEPPVVSVDVDASMRSM